MITDNINDTSTTLW